ncbi:MAG TPA: OsmC family protein [Limnochorda sp.]
MEVHVKHAGGMSFLAKGGSNHWVVMDADPAVGGDDAASRPMELLLMGLAGCTGMDVVSILRKKRVHVDGFEIRVHGERAEEHPKAFTHIEIEYVFYGRDLPRHDLERAVELSQEKYCGAAATLRGTASITYRITVRAPEEASAAAPQA